MLSINLFSQVKGDTTIDFNKRKKIVWIGGSTAYAATMTSLSLAWYGNSEQGSFRFFDDNSQWLQIDKVGHFYSAYHLSATSAKAFQWSGMSEKKAMLWGTLTGIALMTPIEILDGFSPEFGASWGDFISNTGGSLFLYGQYALWKEVRIHPKFSFQTTGFAAQRPDVLGSNFSEQLLKDYNGQTYWLSFDIDKFLPEKNRFPKWLNIAVGYGGENMIFANDFENQEIGLTPYRQYYLGLDFDLTTFYGKSKFWNSIIYVLNTIRLPAPTLEYNTQGKWRGHWIYF